MASSIGARATAAHIAARVGKDLVLDGDDAGNHKVAIESNKLIHRSDGNACVKVALGFKKSGGGGFPIGDHATGATALDVKSAKDGQGFNEGFASRYMFILDCSSTNITAGSKVDFCFKDGDKIGEDQIENALAFVNWNSSNAVGLMPQGFAINSGAVAMGIENTGGSDFSGTLRLVVDFASVNKRNIEV